VCVLAYKSLNGLAPTYLSGLIQLHVPSRSLRSSDHMLMVVPRVRLKHRGDRAFAVAAPKLWPQLCLLLKLLLKHFFYSLAFNST